MHIWTLTGPQQCQLGDSILCQYVCEYRYDILAHDFNLDPLWIEEFANLTFKYKISRENIK